MFNKLDKEFTMYKEEAKNYRECSEVVYTATDKGNEDKKEEKKSPKRKRMNETIELDFKEVEDDPRLTFMDDDEETQLPEEIEVKVAESTGEEEAVLKKTRIHKRDGSVHTIITANDLGDVVELHEDQLWRRHFNPC